MDEGVEGHAFLSSAMRAAPVEGQVDDKGLVHAMNGPGAAIDFELIGRQKTAVLR